MKQYKKIFDEFDANKKGLWLFVRADFGHLFWLEVQLIDGVSVHIINDVYLGFDY